jgi:hypothetical protein
MKKIFNHTRRSRIDLERERERGRARDTKFTKLTIFLEELFKTRPIEISCILLWHFSMLQTLVFAGEIRKKKKTVINLHLGR